MDDYKSWRADGRKARGRRAFRRGRSRSTHTGTETITVEVLSAVACPFALAEPHVYHGERQRRPEQKRHRCLLASSSQRYGNSGRELPTPFPLAVKTRNRSGRSQVAESRKMGTLRRLALHDMNAAARVHRSGWTTPAMDRGPAHAGEDAWFYRERMFVACEVWGAFGAEALVGIVAFRAGWIDQLCVLRAAQRGGIGTALLRLAQEAQDRLSLWTFQRNTRGAPLLRGEGIQADPRNRRRRQRGEGAGRALSLGAFRVATAAGARAGRQAPPGDWSRSWRRCCAGEHARCRPACRDAARPRQASHPRRAGTSRRLHGR